MNETQKNHVLGLAADYSTELIQRVLSGDIGIKEAVGVSAIMPIMMMYRTLPENVVDGSIENHEELVLQIAQLTNDYINKHPMQVHEYISVIAKTMDILLTETLN